MVPTLDELPELKRWTAREAALQWSCKVEKSGGVMGFGNKDHNPARWAVSGFGGKELRCAVRASREKKKTWFNFFNGSVKPRAPLSGANPSVLAGEHVETEDDGANRNPQALLFLTCT